MPDTYVAKLADVPAAEGLTAAEGWVGMRVQFLADAAGAGARQLVFGRTLFAPGGSSHELHRHANAEEVVVIMRGRGIVLNADDEVPVGPGDLAFHPRGAWHGFRTVGDEEVEMLWAWGGAGSRAEAGYEVRAGQ